MISNGLVNIYVCLVNYFFVVVFFFILYFYLFAGPFVIIGSICFLCDFEEANTFFVHDAPLSPVES